MKGAVSLGFESAPSVLFKLKGNETCLIKYPRTHGFQVYHHRYDRQLPEC